MATYVNDLMARLAAELKVGLLRLRKGYVDAAEEFLRITDPANEYPYEFVVYRLTGYRPPRDQNLGETLSGRSLHSDLLTLILDLCDTFDLRPSDYSTKTYTLTELAKRLDVSTKTIQRWRRQGLPTRRMLMGNEQRLLTVLGSSARWFISRHRHQVNRASRFTQITPTERQDIIRRARRMAAYTRATLGEIARRISARSDRAAETIRYTLRNHDRQHPESAIFPYLSAPLADEQKQIVYRCFLNGVGATDLGKRFGRSRGSIYRIINDVRARALCKDAIRYVYNPQFDLPYADEILLAPADEKPAKPLAAPRPADADDLGGYFSQLADTPLLNAPREQDLFRRYNYLKYKADKLRKALNPNRIRAGEIQKIESLLLAAAEVRDEIVRSNLRLVVSIAKRHLGGPQRMFDLVSDGNLSLLKAVEKFDYSRGYRFSTYASWAIMRNFARSVPRERYQLDRFATGDEDMLDITGSLRAYHPNDANATEIRDSIDTLLARLSPRERSILMEHYGVDQNGQGKTFEQLGKQLGLSKERVRQIEANALAKLRAMSQEDTAQR